MYIKVIHLNWHKTAQPKKKNNQQNHVFGHLQRGEKAGSVGASSADRSPIGQTSGYHMQTLILSLAFLNNFIYAQFRLVTVYFPKDKLVKVKIYII